MFYKENEVYTTEIPKEEYEFFTKLEEKYNTLITAIFNNARINMYNNKLGIGDDVFVMDVVKLFEPRMYELKLTEKKKEAEDV